MEIGGVGWMELESSRSWRLGRLRSNMQIRSGQVETDRRVELVRVRHIVYVAEW